MNRTEKLIHANHDFMPTFFYIMLRILGLHEPLIKQLLHTHGRMVSYWLSLLTLMFPDKI